MCYACITEQYICLIVFQVETVLWHGSLAIGVTTFDPICFVFLHQSSAIQNDAWFMSGCLISSTRQLKPTVKTSITSRKAIASVWREPLLERYISTSTARQSCRAECGLWSTSALNVCRFRWLTPPNESPSVNWMLTLRYHFIYLFSTFTIKNRTYNLKQAR